MALDIYARACICYGPRSMLRSLQPGLVAFTEGVVSSGRLVVLVLSLLVLSIGPGGTVT